MGTKTAVLAHLHQAQGEPSPDPAILVFKFDPNLELVNRSHFSHFAFNLWLNVPNSVPGRQKPVPVGMALIHEDFTETFPGQGEAIG